MKLYAENTNYKLYEGNMLDMLSVIPQNSIDSIVTDPPYELNFMNKSWDDSGIAFQKETWEKCFQVLKPGGHMLVFGGSRTFYKIAYAIDMAGFEIRDTIMWIYSQGFPKSLNIGLAIDKKNGVESTVIGHSTNGSGASPNKLNNHAQGDTGIGYMDGSGKEFDIQEPTSEEGIQWKGWGTQLKPAFEPIIIARKPCDGGVLENVLKHGVGGLNIDGCKIPFINDMDYAITANKNQHEKFGTKPMTGNIIYGDYSMVQPKNYESDGRFPSNVILSYDDTTKDEVCGGFPNTGSGNGGTPYNYSGREYNNKDTSMFNGDKPQACSNYNDCGSAARYFYCAKATSKDREEGLTDIKNIHPTVKPTELMQYLIRLVTPKHGTVLDTFNGSGSTGKACMWENKENGADYKYIGIELTPEYLPIAQARIEYVNKVKATTKEELAEQVKSSAKVENRLLNLIKNKVTN